MDLAGGLLTRPWRLRRGVRDVFIGGRLGKSAWTSSVWKGLAAAGVQTSY